jgi:hypothetical protein
MYSIRNILTKEPAAIAEAVRAVMMVLVLANLWTPGDKLLAGIALAVSLVLTLFVRSRVTPTGAPTLEAGAEVAVKGSDDTVIVQPTPPGPEGRDN